MPVDVNTKIAPSYRGRVAYTGLYFGVEVEMEGRNLPQQNLLDVKLPDLWTWHKDGSLRGAEASEYVFSTPYQPAKAREAVKGLFDLFTEMESKLSPSHRTSTHVHMNVSDKTWREVSQIITLWSIVEGLATKWCGARRDGNLFCLAFRDCPLPLQDFSIGMQENALYPEMRENKLKYSALNLYTLRKFGTLEFRSLEGLSNPGKLYVWMEFLEHLYNTALTYHSPEKILQEFSLFRNDEIIQKFLGPLADDMLRRYSPAEIIESFQEGVWAVQDLVYLVDWRGNQQQKQENPAAEQPNPRKVHFIPLDAANQVFEMMRVREEWDL